MGKLKINSKNFARKERYSKVKEKNSQRNMSIILSIKKSIRKE